MAAWRVSFGAVILLLVAGCGGEPAKPANPSPSRATTGAANKLTTDAPSAGKQLAASPSSAKTSTDQPDEPTAPVAANTPDPRTPEASPPEPAPPEPPFELEEGFTQLASPDFEAFGAEADTWEPTPEGMRCSGKPRGYLYSKQSYQNFTLRLDYRFPRPASLKDETKFKGNTGFLVYITGEHKLWPVCLEVQGKHVQMGAIKENGGAQPVTATDDDAARQKARRPVGRWNAIEIVSNNGALSVTLNGVPISKCEPDFLSEGLIGIQAEDHPFEVRRMRIRRD
jgi:hypothetical protein